MTSKKRKQVVEALRECVTAIKSHHSYDYCPTKECAACEARRKAEAAIKLLEV